MAEPTFEVSDSPEDESLNPVEEQKEKKPPIWNAYNSMLLIAIVCVVIGIYSMSTVLTSFYGGLDEFMQWWVVPTS